MTAKSRKHRREELHKAVEQHGDMVFRLAYRILRNRADAEDASQEVFIKYVQTLRQNPVRSPRAWFSVTALNTARNIIRREQNRRRREDQWAQERFTGWAPPVPT